MKYKETFILLMLAIFLFSLTGVFASEMDTPIVGEDTGQLDLSVNEESIEDNLQKDEENPMLTLMDNEKTLNMQNDTTVLDVDSATYSDLADEISQSEPIIKLTHKNYNYNDGATPITITDANKIIDGDGAIIDMAGSTIRAFTVSASGVIIKNLTIKNAKYQGDGGAIYFSKSGTVTNCNFTNNYASHEGGAVYFLHAGTVTNCNFNNNTATSGGGINMVFDEFATVTNCNFTNNSASRDSGAVVFYNKGSVTNCNFNNNTATSYGGAVVFYKKGSVTNCNFADNSALKGGAILSMKWWDVTTDTCIFKKDSDTTFNTHNLPPILTVDNFTIVYNSGRKLTFELKTNSGMLVNNGIIFISVFYKENNTLFGNYHCLSDERWSVDLPAGSYYAIFDTEYAEFKPINRTISVIPRLIGNQDIVIDYDSTSFTVIAIGDDGNPINSVIVKMTTNGKTYSIKTDKNGVAKLPIKLKPKTYTITCTYKGTTVKNTIKVKYTLKTKKTVKIKKTAKLVLKATLKWSSGKAIVGKKVTFKFKGKKYTVKTNKKGLAKVTIKKNIIKKLKKSKTYETKISYKNETVKTKVKVKV